jgi:hypothetical protein
MWRRRRRKRGRKGCSGKIHSERFEYITVVKFST